MRPLLLAAVLGAVWGAAAAGAAGATTTSFPVHGESHVTQVATGPDGNVWFTAEDPDAVGRITPGGAIAKFSQGISSGSTPNGMTAGLDGNLWFAEFRGPRIGRITPGGAVSEFSSPSLSGTQPRAITAGPDGNLWFDDFAGGALIGRVSNLDQNPPTIETFMRSNPGGDNGIAAGPDGRIWFTDPFAHVVGRISNLTSSPPTIETFPVPGSGQPNQIKQGRDGNLWFTDGAGRIGRVSNLGATPPTIKEFSAGITSGALPYGIALGADGNIWFGEQLVNRIGRITPAGAIRDFPLGSVPVGGGLVSGPDGALWLDDYDHHAVVRMTIPLPVPGNGNLLRNPGFEQGAAPAVDGATAAIPGWVTTPNFTSLQYSSGPLTAPPNGGTQFAGGGPFSALSQAIQIADLRRRAEYVDHGLAKVALSALLGGYLNQPDNASVLATFLSPTGKPTGSIAIGPVTAADRGNATKLIPRSKGPVLVPKGTRSIRVDVIAARQSGDGNNAYVDNVSLSLALSRLPAPVVSKLTLSRTPFEAAKSGPSVVPIGKKRKTGTNVAFSDTLAGRTRFKVARRSASKHFTGVGAFTHVAHAGRNRLHFTGRIAGSKLTPGQYRLTVVPRNHEGRRGNALHVGFTILP